MQLFDFREPLNTWTHLIWFLLAIPGTCLLCWRARREPAKLASVLVYGCGVIFCFAGSVLYHSVHGDDLILTCAIIDYIGIYMMVGGTYHVLACNLLHGRWKWSVLTTVWLGVAAGVGMNLIFGEVAPWLYTGLYFALGWGAIFCYFEMGRQVGHRTLRPLLLGGVLYTVGALINRFWYPAQTAHAVMHLFVMVGSLLHFWFVYAVILTHRRQAAPAYVLEVAGLQCAVASSGSDGKA